MAEPQNFGYSYVLVAARFRFGSAGFLQCGSFSFTPLTPSDANFSSLHDLTVQVPSITGINGSIPGREQIKSQVGPQADVC